MKIHNVDYNVLKVNIIKSCRQIQKDELGFEVSYTRLNKLLDDIGLTMVNVGTKSDCIKPENIINLSEYFKDKKLSWFNENKEFTQLVFVKTDAIDDNLSTLLEKMNQEHIDDPDLDKVQTLAEIIATYPCYFATVIAYEANNPERFGKPTYMIGCRANTVTIKEENYKYNAQDMS